nr:hypothetical protein [Tanacetum cinerariifolium]
MIDQGVTATLAARDANRNGDDSHTSGTGTEGVVGLSQWFEKMESIFSIRNCTVACHVKFATCTLQGNALTWWNSYVKTTTPEAAHAIPWRALKKMMTNKYCPRGEIKKLESHAATNNHRNPTCYECGNQGHYKSDCPELRNQDHGNQAGDLKPQEQDTRRTSGNTTRIDPFPPSLILEAQTQVPGPEEPEQAPLSPDYVPGEEPEQAPLSPDYVPGPKEPEQAPPSPVYLPYVPELVYPEYMPPEDDVFPFEEVTKPLPQIPSPPLPIPSPPPDSPTHIEIFESCLSLQKRLRFASPTPSQEVGESSATGAARQNEPIVARDDPYSLVKEDLYGFVDRVNVAPGCPISKESGYGITDTWDELVGASEEIAPTTLHGVNQRVIDLSIVVEQETTIMALAARDANRNGDDSHTSGTAYSQRFQELALMCDRMFPKEIDKVERYVDGLPDTAIEFATKLMNKKINTWAERQADNKRKSDDTTRNNHQQPNKRQNTGRVYAAENGERKESHAATNNHRNPTCYECGNQRHYRSDCPELRNQDHGNQAGGTRSHGMVHALEGGETNQDLNDVENDINA